jgi:ADP-ribose pyrophosphatase
MKPHGPWKIKTSDSVYVDAFIAVRLDQVLRPDGNDGQHVVVNLKPGVCVIAIDEKNCLHLTKEFHYGIGRDSIEGVSGGIERGDDPLATAKRELQEEIGLHAEVWEDHGTVDPFTTVVVSPTRLYMARGLCDIARSPEGTEVIEKVVLPMETALAQVVSGEITHAPTCVLILKAALASRGSASLV